MELAGEAASDLQLILTALENFGTPTSNIATGAYSYTDLNIVQDNSALPRLTNADCQRVLDAIESQDAFKSAIADALALFLPVGAGGVQFPPDDFVCAPLSPLQTRGDQRSSFKVQNLRLTADYTLFGRTASYITIDPGLDRSKQPVEISAPLNTQKVRAALQDALRVVALHYVVESLGLCF